jgi:hypothetical protein
MDPMLVVIILALGATGVALLLGLMAMASGGSTDQVVSTPLMWVRVGLQAFTLVLLIVAVMLERG